MIWLYRLLFLPGLILALPYYGLRMWRRGGYSKDFKHRFGYFHPLPKTSSPKKRIWLQAVSVGEVLAVGPLLQHLQRNGDVEIVLTTTTSTGYAEARKRYSGQVLSIGIFPLDFWPFSGNAWKRIRPDAIVLTESELWPEHLHQARKRNVPAFLVNARMSDKSYERYRKLRPLAQWLFGQLEHIYATSNLDQQRLIELGGNETRITCPGSIKCDVEINPRLDATAIAQLRRELGFYNESGMPCFVLLGSSIWPGEERPLLRAQASLIEAGYDCRLLLVPRHAERAAEIVNALEAQDHSWHQRSKGKNPNRPVQIHLADTTGELTVLSQSANLAFIGKSLPPHDGGQTPIEPAGMGLPLIMGPKMTNFKAISRALVHNGVGIQVEDEDSLVQALVALANDSPKRQAMSKAGLDWHQRNRGSSQRIAESIIVDLKGED
ncbi:3-deoxy-D-manno-octulosonic acid transferase [Coraliomargarita parva]|uniref:3-deoxy-D-manno-octulosonic acid transferase n=1 Tax=Coraliomargarita parva TaxID=3014050 RepID=UPI0022B3D186|nr:3-deoxy-D-manno-octulosonic acid transferase [Coraliomargarita parva]